MFLMKTMSRNILSLNLLAWTGLDGRGWWGVLVLSQTVQRKCFALKGYVTIAWLSGMESFFRRLRFLDIINLLLLLPWLGQRLIRLGLFLRIHWSCGCFAIDQDAKGDGCLKTTDSKGLHLLCFHTDLTIIVTKDGCSVSYWLLRHQILRDSTNLGIPDDLCLMDSPGHKILYVSKEGCSRSHYGRCSRLTFQAKLSFLKYRTPCFFIPDDVQVQHLIVELLLLRCGRPNWEPSLII